MAAAESARRKRHTQFLLGGILPARPGAHPRRRDRGRDARGPGDPRGHGLREDRRHAGDHRPVHADPARRSCSRCSARPGTSSSAPTRRRPRSSRPACWRRAPSSGSPEYVAARVARRADVRGAPDPRAPAQARASSPTSCRAASSIGFLTGVGIQVAMGQVGGMFGITGETGTTLEKFVETLKAIPTETSVPTLVVSLAVLGTILGLERVEQEDPGRPDRGGRVDRPRATCSTWPRKA